MPAPPAASYLLALVNGGQWGHLTVLVGTKDLAERAGGHLTAQAVDIDLLLFMLLTHKVLLGLGVQWPGGSGQGGRRVRGQAGGWEVVVVVVVVVRTESVRPHEHLSFSLYQPSPPFLPLQLGLWLGR